MESDFEGAKDALAKALEIYEGAQDKLGEASVMNSRALLSDKSAVDTQAVESNLEMANMALEMFKDAKDTKGTASVLDTIVQLKLREGKMSHALSVAEEMLKVYAVAGDNVGEANAFMRLGDVYRMDDQLQQALDKTNSALEIYVQLGEQKKKTIAINRMAAILSLAGSFPEAQKAANASLNICRELKDKRGQAATMFLMGNICDEEKEYSKALFKLEKAVGIYKKLDDKKSEALAMDAIARMQLKAFWSLDEPTEPALNSEKALKLLAEIGLDDGAEAAYILNTYAFALLACERTDDAIEKAKDALNTFQELADACGEAFTLTTLAQIYWELKDKKEAINLAQKAHKVAEDASELAEVQWAEKLLEDYGGDKKKNDMADYFKFTDDSGQSIKSSWIGMYTAASAIGLQDYCIVDGFQARGVVEKKAKAKKASSSSSGFVHEDTGAKKESRGLKIDLDFASLGTA